MPHTSTLVQSSDDLFVLTEDGGTTQLNVPSTVTITDERKPRFEVNGVHAVMVNSVDQPLIVDDNGIVLFFSPLAPTAAATVAVGAAGALTGTYGVKYTFAIRTLDDVIVAESGFSPSASVALTADKLNATNIQVMPGLTAANYDDRYDVVRRLYRTAANGAVYFLWHTIEDNTTTAYEGDETDASIAALGAENLATVPFLSYIANYKERMFGVNDSESRETLLYSESGIKWAWPAENIFTMPQIKGDSQSGITALLPRRDALGITKSNMVIQLTGTDDTNFRLVTVSTSVGCVSQESAAIYRDEWYFLGQDGVYKWGEDGLQCISDGRVRSWFTSDDYFDRNSFTSSFAVIDVLRKCYKLYLTRVGSTTVDTWVEFDIENGTWWGPDLTSAYEFTSAFILSSHTALVGAGTSEGCVTIDTDTRSDDVSTAIEVEAIMTPMKIVDPPVTAYWGELTPEVDPQAGGTLSVYPIVGEIDDSEQTVMSMNLTLATESIGRLGYGRFLILRWFNNTLGQVIQLLGFDINPVSIVGRRH